MQCNGWHWMHHWNYIYRLSNISIVCNGGKEHFLFLLLLAGPVESIRRPWSGLFPILSIPRSSMMTTGNFWQRITVKFFGHQSFDRHRQRCWPSSMQAAALDSDTGRLSTIEHSYSRIIRRTRTAVVWWDRSAAQSLWWIWPIQQPRCSIAFGWLSRRTAICMLKRIYSFVSIHLRKWVSKVFESYFVGVECHSA